MGAGVPAAVVGVSLCVTAHNFEEALGADEFLRLTERLRPRFLTLSRRRFLVLLVLITLPLWTLAALAARGEAPGGLRGVLVCIQAGFGANAVAPHVYLSLRLRRYTPGVARPRC